MAAGLGIIILIVAFINTTSAVNASTDDAKAFCLKCLLLPGSRSNQQIWLYPDASDCEHYYQCFFGESGTVSGIHKSCNAGPNVGGQRPRFYFQPRLQQCVPKFEGTCNGSDPCQNVPDSELVFHKNGSRLNCREYYMCTHGYSLKMCCGQSTVFNLTINSCQADDTCNAVCSVQQDDTPPEVITVIGNRCYDNHGTIREADPNNAFRYFQFDWNFFNMTELELDFVANHTGFYFDCANGTVFNLSTCNCGANGEYQLTADLSKKLILLYMPLNVVIEDYSPNHFLITQLADKTVIDANFANFNGNNALEVPGLIMIDPGKRMSAFIALRYSCTLAKSNIGIVSALTGTLDTEGVVFLGQDRKLQMQFLDANGNQLKYSSPEALVCNEWYTFAMVFDGDNRQSLEIVEFADSLTAPNVATMAFKGQIPWLTFCPFGLGAAPGFDAFKGNLAMVFIYRDTLSDAVVGALGTAIQDFVNHRIPVNSLPDILLV